MPEMSFERTAISHQQVHEFGMNQCEKESLKCSKQLNLKCFLKLLDM